MSNCSEIKELLSPYLDGELPEAQHRVVAEHLAACRDCARELDEFAQIDRIAAAATPGATEDEWAGVWNTIQAAGLPRPRARRWLRPAMSFAAAAVLLIALGVATILHTSNSAAAGPAWTVESCESKSPDVSVLVSYDAEADVVVIQALMLAEDGAEDNGNAT